MDSNAYDPISVGRDDSDGEGIVIRAGQAAAIIPRALRDLEAAPADLVANCQHVAAEIARNQAALDEIVPEMRSIGLSWNSIGWCLGISAQAVQKRWGDRADD